MPTMADKLREARELYARLAEAGARLEREHERAARQYKRLRSAQSEGLQDIQIALEAVRTEAEQLKWALRRPFRALLAWGFVSAFLGAALANAARRAGNWLIDWLLALAAGG